jgi:high affinity Mn2+ porin
MPVQNRKSSKASLLTRRRRGRIRLAVWLGLTTTAGAIQAQTLSSLPSPSPDRDTSSAQVQADSAGGQTLDTPLPNKVRGQVPFTAKYAIAGEFTYILQHIFTFRSPYAGPNSLLSRNETELTHTYTLYLGARPTPRFEVYLNPELALGNGVSAGEGLAGYSNGDLIGQPSLRPEPYIARFFVRWRIPLRRRDAPKQTQPVQPGTNLIGGNLPASRLVITAGKFAISDHFDANSYANNARVQFLNNAFINNLAYDKAAETRGYNLGLMVNWVNPGFVLRLGSIAMPTTAGGPDLAYNFANEHSDQLELELHPRLLRGRSAAPLIARLLAYRNVGTMGRYQQSLQAQAAGMAPDIVAVRRSGAIKYGFGLNFEQALGDGGGSGIFGRLGWNDGSTESFSYAEADRFVSFGGQLSGAHWGRPNDVLGVALAQSDLSGAHKAYLEAGGPGLSLGDGRLNYGAEQIAEVYYAYQLSKSASLSLDYQFINTPGYNRDRGPVSLLGLRLHLTH